MKTRSFGIIASGRDSRETTRRHLRERGSVATVFLRAAARLRLGTRRQRNNRSILIVAETKRISNRRNYNLNSRAQISDVSGRRFFIGRGNIFSVRSTRYERPK